VQPSDERCRPKRHSFPVQIVTLRGTVPGRLPFHSHQRREHLYAREHEERAVAELKTCGVPMETSEVRVDHVRRKR